MKHFAKSVNIMLIVAMLSLGVICGSPSTSLGASELPKAISLGTSAVGSTFYVIAVGMSDLITKKTGISCTAEAVGGSDANLRALKQGIIQMAMANTFTSGNAYEGKGSFAKEGPVAIRLMALGQPSMRQLVARVDAGIDTVADLKGKRLNSRRRSNAELELIGDAMLKAYGVDKNDVKIISMARTKEQVDALITGTIDAAILPGGVPAGTLMKLSEKEDVKFIDMPPDKMKTVLNELGPSFWAGVIPAGTYEGQDQAVHVPALSASMVVDEKLSDKAVYEVVKALFTSHDELKMVHKAARHWTVENTLSKFHLPFHPGAIQYFKEIGAWKSEHEQKQQALLKK